MKYILPTIQVEAVEGTFFLADRHWIVISILTAIVKAMRALSSWIHRTSKKRYPRPRQLDLYCSRYQYPTYSFDYPGGREMGNGREVSEFLRTT